MDWRETDSERRDGRTEPSPRRVSPVLQVAAVLLLVGGGPAVLVGVLWIGAMSTPAPTPRPTDPSPVTPQTAKTPKKQVYTRKEFTDLVIGKTSAEFVRDLGFAQGGQNGDRSGNGTTWIYYRRTIDPETGELDESAELLFTNGTVERVTFR